MGTREELAQIQEDHVWAEREVERCKERYDAIFRPIGLALHDISDRGSRGDYEYFIVSWSIIDAEDPTEAAKKLYEERMLSRKKATLAGKQAEITRLQNELDKINKGE